MKLLLLPLIAVILSSCVEPKGFSGTQLGDGKYWIVERPLVRKVPKTADYKSVPNSEVTVPVGFVTDLTSSPRIFWNIFPPTGKYMPAAVVHDYLYWEQPSWCSRKLADEIFFSGMTDYGVSTFAKYSIYSAVRVGGESTWKKNARLRSSGSQRNLPARAKITPTESWADIERRIKEGSLEYE